MSSIRSRNSQGKVKETPKETGANARDPNVLQVAGGFVTPKTVVAAPLTKPKSVAGKSTNGVSSVKDGGSQAPTRKRVADDEHDGKKTWKKTDQSQKEKQQLEKAEADYQKLVRAGEEKTKRDDASKAKRAAELAAKAPRPAAKSVTGTNRAPGPARLEGAGRAAALNDGNFDFRPHMYLFTIYKKPTILPCKEALSDYPITRPTQNSFTGLYVPSALMSWPRTIPFVQARCMPLVLRDTYPASGCAHGKPTQVSSASTPALASCPT